MIVLSAPLEDAQLSEKINSILNEKGIEAMVNSSKEFEVIIDDEELGKAKKALSKLASQKNFEMEVIK